MNAVRAASAQRTFHSAALRASLPSPPPSPPSLYEFKQSKEKDHRAHMNRVGSSCLGLGSSNKTPVPHLSRLDGCMTNGKSQKARPKGVNLGTRGSPDMGDALRTEKAESEAPLESEIRMAMLMLRQRPPRHTGV